MFCQRLSSSETPFAATDSNGWFCWCLALAIPDKEAAGQPLEAMKILQGLKGLKIIGTDVVEVSPPYDPTGMQPAMQQHLNL